MDSDRRRMGSGAETGGSGGSEGDVEFFGADTDQMRSWCDRADQSAETMAELRMTLDQHVGSIAWVGEDAEVFRQKWNLRGAELDSLAERLRAEAEETAAHADEQDQASSADGGSALGDGSNGNADGGEGDFSPRDLPEEPSTGDTGRYKEFDGEIDLSDEALDSSHIEQGQLGDCWFLAGAGAVANRDPDFIREHMRQNEDGTWTVTLYDDGEPVEITVEPTFPENGAGAPDGVNWLSVYEKAAAEYFGGEYSELSGGFSSDAFEMITGREAEKTGEGDFADLEEKLAEGPVAVGTENNDVGERGWRIWESEIDEDNIVPNHAYIVEEVIPADDPRNTHGEPVVVLTNPWGPDGGELDDVQRDGTLTLTQEQYQESFDTTYSVDMED